MIPYTVNIKLAARTLTGTLNLQNKTAVDWWVASLPLALLWSCFMSSSCATVTDVYSLSVALLSFLVSVIDICTLICDVAMWIFVWTAEPAAGYLCHVMWCDEMWRECWAWCFQPYPLTTHNHILHESFRRQHGLLFHFHSSQWLVK